MADHDRRQLELTLTRQGEALITSLVSGVHRMRQQLLGALEPGEQGVFMELLRKFVHLNNEQSRAPMRVQQEPIEPKRTVRPRKSRVTASPR